jgi:anti-anti-sigma factor
MTIRKQVNGNSAVFFVGGRLDTATAPQLDEEIKASIAGAHALVFDFEELEYISSAGLRVILSALKVMKKQGSLTVRNANADIMEIFDVTGFSDILAFE